MELIKETVTRGPAFRLYNLRKKTAVGLLQQQPTTGYIQMINKQYKQIQHKTIDVNAHNLLNKF